MLLRVICVSLMICYCGANFIKWKPEYSIMTNEIGHEPNYDILMDIILAELKYYLVVHHDTVILIPPVSSGFEFEFIGITFSGNFNATGGKFTNPATIKRKGEVSVTHTPTLNKIDISMTVTFSKMDVTFSQYTASVIGISESGSINVTVQNNALFLQITLTFLPHCIVSVSKLEITQMSGVEVNITGLGILDSLESEIVSWVLQSYRTSFTDIIENVIQQKLQEELSKTKICSFKRNH